MMIQSDAKAYFPMSLTRTAKLDPKRNYIFGHHPHGDARREGRVPRGLPTTEGIFWGFSCLIGDLKNGDQWGLI